MKKMVMIIVPLVIFLSSCQLFEESGESFADMQFRMVEEEYDSLPALDSLKSGEVDIYTNFKEVGNDILFDGNVVVSNVIPMYGKGDVLMVNRDGGILFLYKNNREPSAVLWDYDIIGVKIEDNIVTIKAFRTNHIMYLRMILSESDPSHEYLYGW